MKRQLIACFFITLSYLTPLAVVAQQRPTTQKPIAKLPAVKEAPIKLEMPQRQKNLPKAWDEGKLPVPLVLTAAFRRQILPT